MPVGLLVFWCPSDVECKREPGVATLRFASFVGNCVLATVLLPYLQFSQQIRMNAWEGFENFEQQGLGSEDPAWCGLRVCERHLFDPLAW